MHLTMEGLRARLFVLSLFCARLCQLSLHGVTTYLSIIKPPHCMNCYLLHDLWFNFTASHRYYSSSATGMAPVRMAHLASARLLRMLACTIVWVLAWCAISVV